MRRLENRRLFMAWSTTSYTKCCSRKKSPPSGYQSNSTPIWQSVVRRFMKLFYDILNLKEIGFWDELLSASARDKACRQNSGGVLPLWNQRSSVQFHWQENDARSFLLSERHITSSEEPLTAKHTVIPLRITWDLQPGQIFSVSSVLACCYSMITTDLTQHVQKLNKCY